MCRSPPRLRQNAEIAVELQVEDRGSWIIATLQLLRRKGILLLLGQVLGVPTHVVISVLAGGL